MLSLVARAHAALSLCCSQEQNASKATKPGANTTETMFKEDTVVIMLRNVWWAQGQRPGEGRAVVFAACQRHSRRRLCGCASVGQCDLWCCVGLCGLTVLRCV